MIQGPVPMAERILKSCMTKAAGKTLDPETPGRYLRALKELTAGYWEDPSDHIKVFPSSCDSMVVTTGISLVSLCEHHVLPYFGKAIIGYIPNGRILGLSKFSRIVRVFSRRMTTQENLADSIANFLCEKLSPKGLGVILKATHTCASLRGAEEEEVEMVVSSLRGIFLTSPSAREEFYKLASI